MTGPLTGPRPRVLIIALLVLAGCRHVPTPQERQDRAEALAAEAGWQRLALPVQPFTLVAWLPEPAPPADTLTVYIEGDGLAWRTRSRISGDPTPVRPLALELALAQKQGAAAYLARPCQFVTAAEAGHCDEHFWSDARFSEPVIAATDAAISRLRERFDARLLRLVGYSGGGAVAALVAARRDDVSALITVAGNLDHGVWTRHHRVSPLRDSLNPADAWRALQRVPQLHFVGGEDRIVGTYVAESYRARFSADHRPPLRIVEGFDHGCCWARDWPLLLDEAQGRLETERKHRDFSEYQK